MTILLNEATLKETAPVVVVIVITDGWCHKPLLEHNQWQNRRKAAVQPLFRACHWTWKVL